MATAVNNYVFEVNGNLDVEDIQRFIESLSAIKKDETLKLEERKLLIVTTTRADVAAVLEPIFESAQIKRTWKKKQLENGSAGKLKDACEPVGIAPYQGV